MKRFVLLFLSAAVLDCFAHDKIVYIIPHSDNAIANKKYATGLRNALKKLGYNLKVCSGREYLHDAHRIVCYHHLPDLAMMLNLMRYPKEKLILFLREPPTLFPLIYTYEFCKMFGAIYSWHDGLVAQKNYRKFFYSHPLKSVSNRPTLENKKFCTMFATNKNFNSTLQLYGQRRTIVQYFEHNAPDDFDLYGKGWHDLRVAKGYRTNKIEILKQYKFCICYENSRKLPGYITEKIFDAFVAGVVPIYWGDQSTKKVIPQECFIDREKFSSDHALYVFLKKMTKATYNKYVKAIENYLKSDLALLFSQIYFTDIFLRAIKPFYPRDKVFTKEEQQVLARCYAVRSQLEL